MGSFSIIMLVLATIWLALATAAMTAGSNLWNVTCVEP